MSEAPAADTPRRSTERSARSGLWRVIVIGTLAMVAVWATLPGGLALPVRGATPAAALLTLLIGALTWIAVRSVQARQSAIAQMDQAEHEAERRERELSATVMSLQELIFRTDANGAISFVNQHWLPVMGSSLASAIGQRPWELAVSADRDRVWSLFTRGPGLVARRAQASLVTALGAVRTFDVSVIPLHHKSQITGFACSAMDITGRVAAAQQLQAQLAFTQLVMETSPLPQSVITLDGQFVIVNKAWEDFTGQQLGDNAYELPIDESMVQIRPLHEADDRKKMRSALRLRHESSVTHRDGSLREVMVDKALLHGADGRASGILCVFMDISEFRNAERATREARDAAEETSRAKTEFIANISHELRTPLQSIIGFSELGLTRSGEQLRLRAMFEDIHGAGQRMLSLVNDLLDVSKIDSKVGVIHLERTDLRVLVHEVAREIDPLLRANELTLQVNLPEVPMRAKVDPPRYQQVIRNVLANAIKFSPPGGCIEIVGERADNGELRLVVRDEGPGIPAAELDKVFDAFVQSSQTKDGSGGTGLGLAICRKIIDAHGGSIHAENLPQRGAAFHIVVPSRVGPGGHGHADAGPSGFMPTQ
jgi:PAS domain S-box-containing protein